MALNLDHATGTKVTMKFLPRGAIDLLLVLPKGCKVTTMPICRIFLMAWGGQQARGLLSAIVKWKLHDRRRHTKYSLEGVPVTRHVALRVAICACTFGRMSSDSVPSIFV